MLGVWLRVVVGLAVLTLLASDRVLLVWAGALAAAWALGGLLLGRVLDGLAVSQAISSAQPFAGETVTVHVRLTNRSIFPLPWVRLQQSLPRALERRSPRWFASLPPGGTFHATYRLRAGRRGVYRVGRVAVEAGDWFGLWRRRGRIDVPLWVTVLPRPLAELPLVPPPPRLPEGERPDAASPFPAWEPAGLREYRPGDPLRAIAWKATARRGDLVVRLLPPVRDRALMIVLDLRPGRWPAAHRAAWLERAVSFAAAWIASGAQRDEPIGMFVSGRAVRHEPEPEPDEEPSVSGPRGPVRLALPPRRGPAHRQRLLETLAALEPDDDPVFDREAQAALRRLAGRTSVIWIAGTADAASVGLAAAACRGGHAVSLVFAQGAGAAPAAPAPGIRLWPLPPGEGEAWN